MGIFYPDNEKRGQRLVELGTDTQDYLNDARNDFESYTDLLHEVNDQIAQTYKETNLQPPATDKQDLGKIVNQADLSTEKTILPVVHTLTAVADLFATVKFLAPGASRFLVATGTITEEQAARVLVRVSASFLDEPLEITAGELAGSILGGIVGGALTVGVDLAIEAATEAEEKSKLVDGIHKIYPLRVSVLLSKQKAATLNDSLRAIKTTLDALEGTGVEITDAIIQNLIRKDAEPSIKKAKAITVDSVRADLLALDSGRSSYLSDDP